jgi:hypothetical protein
VSKFRKIVIPKDNPALIPASESPLGSIIDPSRLTSVQTDAEPQPVEPEVAPLIPPANIPKLTSLFLLAGKALFTVTNPKGDHYTFKVRKVVSEWPVGSGTMSTSYFVSVKASGGVYPYRYIGLLNADTGGIKCTAKSEFIVGTKEYNVAAWACGVVINMKNMPDGYKIEHAGKCGRCGLTLTDPESIERGIGPDCWATMGGK